MKQICAEKVAKEVAKCTKKLKVGEVVGLLVKTIDGVEEHQNIKFRDEDINTILSYFSLTLLARTHNSKEYEKILDECSIEVRESEA